MEIPFCNDDQQGTTINMGILVWDIIIIIIIIIIYCGPPLYDPSVKQVPAIRLPCHVYC